MFERFHIDMGLDDPLVEPVEYLTPPAYLAFTGIPTTPIPCYAVTQYIAEKLHALVRPRPVETSRIKDLVDILLFACMDSDLLAERLYAAIQAVFKARKDQIPAVLDQVPISWRPKFNQFTRDLELPFISMMLFWLLKVSSTLYLVENVVGRGIQKAGNGKAVRPTISSKSHRR